MVGTSRFLLPVDIVRIVDQSRTITLPKSNIIERLRQQVLLEVKKQATSIL
jgi:hypothetical protein